MALTILLILLILFVLSNVSVSIPAMLQVDAFVHRFDNPVSSRAYRHQSYLQAIDKTPMQMNRRTLLAHAAAGAMSLAALSSSATALRPAGKIKAIAFDAFPIFDPRPIFQACERMFPGHGNELAQIWRTRQFEYQWLRALGGRYADFWNATRDALLFAASSLSLDITAQQCDALMNGYLQMVAWPDVKPALQRLREFGIKVAFLSNATTEILNAGIANSQLDGLFDAVISTDRIRTYKPDPRAYQLGVDVLGLDKNEILFVAFAGWDVAGAKWFGYPTFWNNRQGATREQLGVEADAVGATLAELLAYVSARDRIVG